MRKWIYTLLLLLLCAVCQPAMAQGTYISAQWGFTDGDTITYSNPNPVYCFVYLYIKEYDNDGHLLDIVSRTVDASFGPVSKTIHFDSWDYELDNRNEEMRTAIMSYRLILANGTIYSSNYFTMTYP